MNEFVGAGVSATWSAMFRTLLHRGQIRRAADLERAREVLKADEGGFDEDELARLSEEAGKENAAEP